MKLLFVGDVMIGRLVNKFLKKERPEYPWGDTLPIFRDADLRACNLECVISDRGIPWSVTPKAFYFRSDTKNIEVLRTAGINLVSLANNHTLDFEYEAMYEMIKVLDLAGIKHAGAGYNDIQASRPAILEINGIRIGFISFTDNVPEWEGKEHTPGIFYVPVEISDKRTQVLLDIIKETKDTVDLLIVSAHWGPNWGYRPQPGHIPFGHLLIDNGADIVYGHSCHVFQGIEIYNGRPILYSTGNFIDDYAVDEIERNDESFTYVVGVDGSEITYIRLYPTVIKYFQARLAEPPHSRVIASKMETLCSKMGTKIEWTEEGHLLILL